MRAEIGVSAVQDSACLETTRLTGSGGLCWMALVQLSATICIRLLLKRRLSCAAVAYAVDHE